MKKKKNYKNSLLFIALFLSYEILGQVVPPPMPPPPPPGLPIDAGILLLLISGAFYGLIKSKK